MKKYLSPGLICRRLRNIFVFAFATLLFLTCAWPAAAQKEKKKKKDDTSATGSSTSVIPLPDEQQVDYTLSEALGAWQVGDIEKLHKDYADDVTVVNSLWGPPVIGWANYLALYQQQKARMQQVRLDRSNTYIRVSGNVAWACYQWEFAAVVDGRDVGSRGQTTVVLEKRNNHWVIVHNHTSFVEGIPSIAPTNSPAGPQQPAKPGGR
jgi:ketosteroid isomerase-like protein